MNINTAGESVYHYDMCAYCSLDTAGQHEPDCPLMQALVTGLPVGESYIDFVKRKQKEIDEHPEWGIEYF